MRQVRRQRTLRWYYTFSKGIRGSKYSRARFLALLAHCTRDQFRALVRADLARGTNASSAELRSLSFVESPLRTSAPDLSTIGSNPAADEQVLQWLFMKRGYLQFESERVIARELPVSTEGVAREGWVDLLVIDSKFAQPILVELKQAEAGDSLTGVLLEVLAHWSFHMRHLSEFQTQLANHDLLAGQEMHRPGVAVVAPERYFANTIRRSADSRRRNDVKVAFEMIECMREEWNLNVRLLAIENDWQRAGVGFAIADWKATAM